MFDDVCQIQEYSSTRVQYKVYVCFIPIYFSNIFLNSSAGATDMWHTDNLCDGAGDTLEKMLGLYYQPGQ